MYGNAEIEFRNIATAVNCPACGKKYTVKLGVDFLSKHIGETIAVICLDCSKSRIAEVNKPEGN